MPPVLRIAALLAVGLGGLIVLIDLALRPGAVGNLAFLVSVIGLQLAGTHVVQIVLSDRRQTLSDFLSKQGGLRSLTRKLY